MKAMQTEPTPTPAAETAGSSFKVYRMNECDWWLARNIDEAIADYIAMSCSDAEEARMMTEEARELTEEELDSLKFFDEEALNDKRDPRSWKCECGAMCSEIDPAWRWNGRQWEHHHGYPIGHEIAVNIHMRSFREELARRIAAGVSAPEQFASTEI
jgi:hypothetical protein